MRVLSVLGTRPEGIKFAPVIRALEAEKRIESIVCLSGQHREMLDSVLSLFEIRHDINLRIMRAGADLTEVTCTALNSLRKVVKESRPDVLLVQGDTTTAMAAALAAYYDKVRVAHIEAGLRTGNIYAPWPEEVNRRIVGVIADIHFAPTSLARENLLHEGVPGDKIVVTGNTVIDALLGVLKGIHGDREFIRHMHQQFTFLNDEPKGGSSRKLILVTGHRRESFGTGFENICNALRTLAQRPDVRIVYPVHLNANVREPVNRILGGMDNVVLLEPMGYRPFVYLMHRARLILTDSGGVQEEAPTLGKPVLVMRDVTERGEAVDVGAVRLVGTDSRRIVEEVVRLLDNATEYSQMVGMANPYGDGRASERIVAALLERYGASEA